MRTLVVSIAFFAATAASHVAHADEPMFAAMRREVFAPLNLTAEQKSQLKALYQASKAQAQTLRSQVRDTGQALAAALTGDASDAQLVDLHQKFDAARAALTDFRFQGILKVRQMLTPEQRGHFNDLFLAFVQNHRGHHGQ
jgi:protein CpxP